MPSNVHCQGQNRLLMPRADTGQASKLQWLPQNRAAKRLDSNEDLTDHTQCAPIARQFALMKGSYYITQQQETCCCNWQQFNW
jgi:hypothetical protein